MAFLAGLLSVLSPCVFPLLPAYAAHLGGRAVAVPSPQAAGTTPTHAGPGATEARVLANGAAFVAGFTAVFVVLFYILSVFEVTLLIRHRHAVNVIAGTIVIVFALHTLGVLRLGFLLRERRLHLAGGHGLPASFLLGVSFAAGWSPCIGPQLGAILALAVNGGFGGLPFMLTYSIGLAVPFLLVAGLADRLQGAFRAVNRRLGAVNLAAGFLLLLFGLLLVTDRLELLSGASLQSPFNL